MESNETLVLNRRFSLNLSDGFPSLIIIEARSRDHGSAPTSPGVGWWVPLHLARRGCPSHEPGVMLGVGFKIGPRTSIIP